MLALILYTLLPLALGVIISFVQKGGRYVQIFLLQRDFFPEWNVLITLFYGEEFHMLKGLNQAHHNPNHKQQSTMVR